MIAKIENAVGTGSESTNNRDVMNLSGTGGNDEIDPQSPVRPARRKRLSHNENGQPGAGTSTNEFGLNQSGGILARNGGGKSE